MKILITGSSGFLGRHLYEKLKKQAHNITCCNSKNCDLTDASSLFQFDHIHFDLIYHLAAWTQAGDFCLRHPGEQWLINQKINTHILSWWKEKQPQATLIAMGTSCGYDPELPLIEENYLLGKPIDSLLSYAMTKRMLLIGMQALHAQFGLNYQYLIPTTLYGPNYHRDQRGMHFIFDLIVKILRGKKRGEKVVLWGDGEQKRELIHIHDFVGAMLSLNEMKIKNAVINIGSSREYSIKEFAKMIADMTDYPFDKIEYDTEKYVGARSKLVVTQKLQKLLPSFAPVDIREGILETIRWCEQNQLC